MSVSLLRRRLVTVLVVAAAVFSAAAVALSRPAVAVEIDALPASGSVTVNLKGNGHGHGMSQYGARGAAIAGLTAAQIVSFYYPGTTLVTLSPSPTIRVNIGAAGAYTCVQAKAGLTAPGVQGYLPTTNGITRYRLVPSGTGLALQSTAGATCGGSAWTTVANGLAPQADITSNQGYVRLYLNDGTSTDYRGTVGAVRSGAGELTINRVGLDGYTMGVVPREMPASWASAAVQAQAIAARSYGEYEREHAGSGAYDICDTSQCQVYGGMTHYDAAGSVLWTDDPAAVTGNAGQVVQYQGSTAFTQFSASDGGWTAAGGQPYLIAQADPYDNTASGDPYLAWSDSVPVSQLAQYYGLARVTQIEITQRDGHGQWGGRVLAGYVDGATGSGASARIATTGFALQAAMGLPDTWFDIESTLLAPNSGGTTVSPSSGSVEMFSRDPASDLIARQYVNGTGWSAVQDLGSPAAGLTWDPDAATWGSGHIDVAARDGNGHLVIDSQNSGTWSGWRVYPQVMSSSPAAVSPVVNELDVFYLGTGGTLWTVRWTQATGWSSAAALPGVTNAASGPDATAAVQTTGAISVDYRGTDGRIWLISTTSTGWGTPTPANPTQALPSPAAALDPGIDNAGVGTPSVYYTAVNGSVYHSAYTQTGTWTKWQAVPGSLAITSAPDVSNEGPTHVDVVAGSRGLIESSTYVAASGWRPWSAVFS